MANHQSPPLRTIAPKKWGKGHVVNPEFSCSRGSLLTADMEKSRDVTPVIVPNRPEREPHRLEPYRLPFALSLLFAVGLSHTPRPTSQPTA
jgi:hypothetical protein